MLDRRQKPVLDDRRLAVGTQDDLPLRPVGAIGPAVGKADAIADPPQAAVPGMGTSPRSLSPAVLAAGPARHYAEFRIAIGGAALCPIHVDY